MNEKLMNDPSIHSFVIAVQVNTFLGSIKWSASCAEGLTQIEFDIPAIALS